MTKQIDYSAMAAELDAILDQLQAGEISIDEALPAYEKGMKLVNDMEAYLKTTENRIVALKAKLSDQA